MTRFHFIGIGGTGLSAIARVLLESDHSVSGSDLHLSAYAQTLRDLGAAVFEGHHPQNIGDADIVIRSSAIPDHNSEVQAAYSVGIPVLKRSDFLKWIMQDKVSIAIAGTHGKTTTTAMIAWIFTEMIEDPSFIIGSDIINLGVNAHAGKGKAFIIEADEYDRMFLGLNPHIAVVTNVEHDHPDCYPTPEEFFSAFVEFIHNIPPGGVLLACSDDQGAKRLLLEAEENGYQALSYGIGNTRLTYQARNMSFNQEMGGYSFDVFTYGKFQTRIKLRIPGIHNVLNSLAAVGVADQYKLSMVDAAKTLSEFLGTCRRFEKRGEIGGITLIDDYAHHPTEIRATLQAARTLYPQRRVWAVWQPHTFSRTKTLLTDFASAFDGADQIVITDIYSAREHDSNNFSSNDVLDAMTYSGVHYIPAIDQVAEFLLSHLVDGDIVIVLSAGNADRINNQVLAGLKKLELTVTR